MTETELRTALKSGVQPARKRPTGIPGGADGTFHLLYFITFLVFIF
jgi:hypothetical protein